MSAARFEERDLAFMRRALSLARRGQGRVEPNPMVGCVVVKGGRVIGEGHHRAFGRPHAEVNALRHAGAAARGATVYVTLEPCAHSGKTPPCADALIDAGVKRVVAGMIDPHAPVAGRGLRKLRSAGIDVGAGCLRKEAEALNRAYLTRLALGRPLLILKWAQSVDGRLIVPKGQPRRISGDEAHRWVHRVRGRMDGILVGVHTVLRDDPLLTARDVPVRRVATRIVLDSRLRTPLTCRMVRSAGRAPVLVLTTHAAARRFARRRARLLACGVMVEACRTRGGRVDLADAVQRLAARGMTNVLIEGGPTVLSELLARSLADEVFVFTSPRLIGGRGGKVEVPAEVSVAAAITTRRVGRDTLFHLTLDSRPAI